jgi:hypothetical protein
VKNDPKLRALEPGRLGRMNDPATVEAFLRAMPISPREYLQIDMHQRRYEVMVPRFLQLWHQEWIGYHEDEARRLYGEGARELRLLDHETPAEGQEASRVAVGVLGGVNRNVAATSTPTPDEFQGEIQIAANPRDPTQIVAAANTWDDVGGASGGNTQAVFSSNDGGTTWAYTCAPGAPSYAVLPACMGTVFGSDPALSWNDNNEVFDPPPSRWCRCWSNRRASRCCCGPSRRSVARSRGWWARCRWRRSSCPRRPRCSSCSSPPPSPSRWHRHRSSARPPARSPR